MSELIRTEGLTKEFPGVVAVDNVDLVLEEGKVYGLVGENGAGKSTFIKLLTGLHSPTDGKIMKRGEEIELNNSNQARREEGIVAVQQISVFVPTLSVAENIFLNELNDYYEKGLVNYSSLEEKAKEVLNPVNIDVDVSKPASSLSVSDLKLAEVAKNLRYDSDVIIFDETTAPLERDEVEMIFDIIRRLKEQGKAIIFISHRLEEVLEISDEVVVLRDGELVGKRSAEGTQESDIFKMMAGKEMKETFPERDFSKREEESILSMKNVTTDEIKDVSFDLNRGEIVALAGLRGQGQSEVLRVLAGRESASEGKVFLNGEEISLGEPENLINNGILHVSDNPDEEELCLTRPLRENVTISGIDKLTKRLGYIDGNIEREEVKKYVDDFDIVAPSMEEEVKFLSGGNRQKVVLARLLFTEPKILLLDQPTKGIDVGTKRDIYGLLRKFAKQGISSLVYLTEREEVLKLPDRVFVMCEGEITDKMIAEDITEEELLSCYYN